eukprot:m.431252 g.431252  ORF g.431252 m.431252 type:complete len:52 (-) comp17274_c0_seq1:2848-3003(-)
MTAAQEDPGQHNPDDEHTIRDSEATLYCSGNVVNVQSDYSNFWVQSTMPRI